MVERHLLALPGGLAHAALLLAVPLACGARLVALLVVASTAEQAAARPERGVPPLALLSALALLCLFWIALCGPGGSSAMVAAGAALALAGTALRDAAIRTLGNAFVSRHQVACIMTRGPYAFMRHPSELGQLLLGIGAAVLMGSGAAAVWWATVVLPMTFWRTRREEAVLRRSPRYATYAARVPGLWPRGAPAGRRTIG